MYIFTEWKEELKSKKVELCIKLHLLNWSAVYTCTSRFLSHWQLANMCFGVSAVLKTSFKNNNNFISELDFLTVEKNQWEVGGLGS